MAETRNVKVAFEGTEAVFGVVDLLPPQYLYLCSQVESLPQDSESQPNPETLLAEAGLHSMVVRSVNGRVLNDGKTPNSIESLKAAGDLFVVSLIAELGDIETMDGMLSSLSQQLTLGSVNPYLKAECAHELRMAVASIWGYGSPFAYRELDFEQQADLFCLHQAYLRSKLSDKQS